MIYSQNLSPILFELGPLEVRWYGFLFAVGIAIYYALTRWMFKREGYKLDHFESLIVYLFVGVVIGARLGHIFFYQAEYYLSNPVEILKIWNGGLASHGATLGLFFAYLIWTRVHKVKFTKYIDLMSVAVMIPAGLVRVGNFFNSEIVGKATDGSWGVIFERLGEDFPRHPSQFYEAGLAFLVFAVLFTVYKRAYKKVPEMTLFFLLLLLYFASRFGVEFWKERHVLMDTPLSMGQILSIVPVLAAVAFFVGWYPRLKKRG